MQFRTLAALLGVAALTASPGVARAAGEAPPPVATSPGPDYPTTVAELEAMSARFAPVDVVVDLTALPEHERFALAKLVEASLLVDARSCDRSALGAARLRYFLLNKGPWSRLDHDAPFIPGVGPKPAARTSTRPARLARRGRAVDRAAPRGDRRPATGFFTTIRRSARAGGAVRRGALQPRVPGRARARGPPGCARPRRRRGSRR
jgi:hypothetical protein